MLMDSCSHQKNCTISLRGNGEYPGILLTSYLYIYIFTYNIHNKIGVNIYAHLDLYIIYTIHVCIHVYMYTYIHIYIYTYIHIYIHTYIIYIYTYIHVYIYTYIQVYIHVYTCIYDIWVMCWAISHRKYFWQELNPMEMLDLINGTIPQRAFCCGLASLLCTTLMVRREGDF